MRHQKKRHKLGRTAPHRKATLAALASALIEHKRIETTVPKAKALRTFVEPLITRAKDDSTHNRREAFRHLRNKHAVTELFGEVAAQVGDRPGGYTRVVRLGQRQGDNAEMAVIELVDWNDVKPDGAAGAKKKTRRGGGRGRRGQKAAAEKAAPKKQEKVEEPQAVDDTEPAEEPDAVEEAEEPEASVEAEEPEAHAEAEEAEVAEEAEAQAPDTAEEPTEPAEEPPTPAAEARSGEEASEPAAKGTSTKMHDAPKTAADPEVNEHPDAPQGADPGTGDPPAEAGKGDQGVAGGSRHRG